MKTIFITPPPRKGIKSLRLIKDCLICNDSILFAFCIFSFCTVPYPPAHFITQ